MDGAFRVGVDVGSTTIKIVILDESNSVVYRQYLRHFSNVVSTLKNMIDAAHAAMPKNLLSVMFTGSAGIGLSECLDVSFVQEVVACTQAVKKIIPDTDTVIELGGEDAKITYFGGSVEQRMNGVCAGGTGAFIDHMAALLNTDAAGLNELAKQYKNIYPIASRCGVFAKTDVQALMNEGVSKEDIAASILQAVVNQTIGSLAQGRPIRGKVALLGGPLCFLSELRRRFVETLGLREDQVINPESSQYFVAIGAALSSREKPITFGCLYERIPRMNGLGSNFDTNRLVSLFADQKEIKQFQDRHAQHAVPRQELSTYTGKAYLGIDAGSTTTKLALIGENASLLYSYYGSNQGKPLDTVIEFLKKLYAVLPPKVRIVGSVVTGYGERLIQAALQVDIGEVETVAHLKAANYFLPGVTFVLDIGGQDMKSFFVRDGVIESIMLNEACSAGCGSFIENFAQSVGMTVPAFVQQALEASHPVELGTRCTVFMNSKVKQAQKEGAGIGDISAGLAISVVKNALFKVIRLKNTEELGKKIVVQGGTFYNDAVLRAMELILDREVVRPDIAGIMGAYGAALLAQERCQRQEQSTLLTAGELAGFSASSDTRRCSFCGNHCLITVQRFPTGKEYYAGNRCERGTGQEKNGVEVPSLYAYKYKRLFRYAALLEANAPRGTVGIPRVLNMYEDYPFWFTFFTALGYRVVLSANSSPKLYEKGLGTIPSETVCYPAKLVHGHIADLIDKGVKKIFYPCIVHNTGANQKADKCYNCPIVSAYPENIAANMDVLQEKEITFWHPFLPLNHSGRLEHRLSQELAGENLTRREINRALEKAYAEQAAYKADVRQKGEEALVYMKAHHGKGVILVGRPYHIDPEINHGLPELIQSFGLTVLSEDSIQTMSGTGETLRVLDQWAYHSRLYAAAEFAAQLQYPKLELIQLNSFGCGLDAVTMDQVKEILDRNQKIHTIIKLDEISNLGAARIRIRSLLAALREREKESLDMQKQWKQPVHFHKSVFTAEMKQTHTILAPQMSPVHFQFLQTSLQKAGYRVIIPDVPDKTAVDEGLKYVHNDACYPAILVIGQMISALKSGNFDKEHTAIMMAQTGGGCRASNYLALMRKALQDAGMSEIPVMSIWGEKSPGFSLTLPIFKDLVMGILYGDLLMRLVHRIRPYEKVAGSTDKLYAYWAARCQQALSSGNRRDFPDNIQRIIHDFDQLPIYDTLVKPRVGIVGEILVKYHPGANNNIIKLLEQEQAEVVVPDLLNFFLYTAHDRIVECDMLSGSFADKVKAIVFIKALEFYRKHMERALLNSKRFEPPHSIKELAAMAQKHLSLCNMTGEGWLLTGEIAALLRSGIKNVICVQPFGCLPNHIVAKGMFKELRRYYKEANIVSLDYDSAASEVNQLNRIKLMLSVAEGKIG